MRRTPKVAVIIIPPINVVKWLRGDNLKASPHSSAYSPVLTNHLALSAITAIVVFVAACEGDSSPSGATGSIQVGAKPWSVALDEDRGLLYAGNEFDNTVSVVDIDSGEVIGVVDSGTGPGAIAVDAASGHAYVANAFSNDVTVLDGTDVVFTIEAGLQPWDIAVDSGRRVYVANSGDGTVSVVDVSTLGVMDTFKGFREPWGVAVSADGASLYVADAATDEVLRVDPDDGTILARGPAGERPRGIALDEESGRLYVANTETANISVLSLLDLTPVATIGVGLAPLAVAVNADQLQVYVVNSLADNMSVIDSLSNTVVSTVPAGRKPWDVVVSDDGKLIYVAASASGEVLVMSADQLLQEGE